MLPVLAVLGALLVVWYAGAAWPERAAASIERVLPDQPGLEAWPSCSPLTWSMERPVLPAPHQVALDLWRSLVDWPLDSPRNLLFHVGGDGAVHAGRLRAGHAAGRGAGGGHRAFAHAGPRLLPWIVASQTVPVLAIAPIVW